MRSDNSVYGNIKINGLADHYHTGDEIELSVSVDSKIDNADWSWYTRESDENEWKAVNGLQTEIFSREATRDGLQIKAALVDDKGQVVAESEPVQATIDDHHGNDEETRRIYNGFFYNTEIKDRELSDWEGDWQSVYPYLLSGDLDEVFEEKAAQSDSMTFEEYKEYYAAGYETNVNRITIEDNRFTFFYEDGQESTAEYEYDGYEILEYEKGNRGVRFVYSRVEESEEMPQYIQFSDHLIAPKESSHYHLYWENDRNELLSEVMNWPTYYPNDLDIEGIIRDMLAH
ncbi:metal-binding protein ZinT [Jeotgalibaca ciconiae]|uniref:Metal-binding protein ZinT n=1 Tax=Jeotgalibaca ciconiae TaxID=2496265 RepID=A0A3S9HAN5_9LACT|nr:metal-binding protein ZinT [Jeotgalibaca ciconiae]